jgi:hypothetical protein
VIAFRQAPDRVKMVGKDDGRKDFERPPRPDPAGHGAEQFDVVDENGIAVAFGEIHCEKVGAAGDLGAPVVGHWVGR